MCISDSSCQGSLCTCSLLILPSPIMFRSFLTLFCLFRPLPLSCLTARLAFVHLCYVFVIPCLCLCQFFASVFVNPYFCLSYPFALVLASPIHNFVVVDTWLGLSSSTLVLVFVRPWLCQFVFIDAHSWVWSFSSRLFRLTHVVVLFNCLTNDKILDWSKLKAFADDKINVTEKIKFILGRVENIVENGENAGNQHFSFSHNVFTRCPIQSR